MSACNNTFISTAPGAAFVSMMIYPNPLLALVVGCVVGYWLHKIEEKKIKEKEDNDGTLS